MARQKIRLDDIERARLEALASSELDRDLSRRATIVLMLADGKKTLEIAAKVGVNKDAVTRWKRRYLEGGVEALRSRHGGGPGPSAGAEGLRDRIEEAISSNSDATWKRGELAEAVGTSLPALGRELKAMGVTLERRTSWSFEAETGVGTRNSCLSGIFLSRDALCVTALTSSSPLCAGAGEVVTRNRSLAGALGRGTDGLSLADAIWTASDHASDPGKKVPRDLRWFLESVASSMPRGDVSCHAVTLGDVSWTGGMPEGLSVVRSSDAEGWEREARALVAQLAGVQGMSEATRLMDAVHAFLGACLPTTDPLVWTRGVTVADGTPGPGADVDDAGAGAPQGRTFETVEEALASVCGGATEGDALDCSMVVVARGATGVEYRVVDAPVPFPGASSFSFSSPEGLMGGFDAMEGPMLRLRNEAGKVASSMLVGMAKKNSIRAASQAR